MRRRALTVLLLASGFGVLWFLSQPSAAERAAWIADLDRLEQHTATAYANLGQRLASRHLSPLELDATARAAIASAGRRAEAAAALQRFVAAFDDAHFRASPPIGPTRRWLRRLLGKERSSAGDPLASTASGTDACAALGARDQRAGPLDWSALPGFAPSDHDAASHPFPAGTIPRSEGAPLALLRIGLFDAYAYPQLCAAEWERFRQSLASSPPLCDEACRDSFHEQLERALIERLDAQLAELAATGAELLVVDVTGNGGGTGIVGKIRRHLTAHAIPQRASGFIRHPHSVSRLTAMANDLRTDLAHSDLSAHQRQLLAASLVRLERAVTAASTPCDLSQLWSLPAGAELSCENIGRLDPLAPEATSTDLAGLASSWLVRDDERGDSARGWTRELVIVVDRRTASAAEDFAASLQDAGAARIAGERTLGVGCGYTNGGVSLELPATGLLVRAPDCVRFRADGSNEAAGVTPEIPVEWKPEDDPAARARRVIARLLG